MAKTTPPKPVEWRKSYRPARQEEVLGDGVVRCHLSPRNCRIEDGRLGFCKVRGNVGGRLVTFNYGKGVHLTEEVIETEAVFHYMPGSRILSLGNIGCMLNCGYCHNWKTSQAKYVEDKDVHEYTPESVVETAIRHGIPVLSWTYNDPVVWHEFVIDTARLARRHGLINLYKSALYITEEAVDELLPHIDIFSISIKAIDEAYYRRITTGRLEPVLRSAKKVYEAGKHVEISNLMVTDLSDDEENARKMAGWVLEELGPEVPLHFVRFHPDYRMRNSTRTPLDRLRRAQEVAREMGVRHVYLGNVYDQAATDTRCHGCGATLVTRFGLHARISGLDPEGRCTDCGLRAGFVLDGTAGSSRPVVSDLPDDDVDVRTFDWHGDICSLHIEVRNPTAEPGGIFHRPRRLDRTVPWTRVALAPGESYRFLLSKGAPDEEGLEVAIPRGIRSNLHEVFDRAHFPTVSLDAGPAGSGPAPLPIFPGNQQKIPSPTASPGC